ncbi:MAG: YdcF family protein [Candidatus Eremiobacteraeota bacterium]|nr:YdcF family protein [Candidatus Eremiobacteraeota bacterium]
MSRRRRRRTRPSFRSAVRWLVGGVLLSALAVLLCNVVVIGSTERYRFEEVAAVPARPIALVLGAGLNPDQTPSGMLADRLDAGAALLRAGKVRALLFSGDNGTPQHNELAAMRTYALGHGVPADRIVLDYAGFDTYDSCYRARYIFGVRRAVVVTQEFHLARATFLCRSLGIDAVGMAEPDWGKYGSGMMTQQALREVAARVKAVLDDIVHPRPTVLGPPERLPVSS